MVAPLKAPFDAFQSPRLVLIVEDAIECAEAAAANPLVRRAFERLADSANALRLILDQATQNQPQN